MLSIAIINKAASISATSFSLGAGWYRITVTHMCTGATGGVPTTPGSISTVVRWYDSATRNTKPAADLSLDYPSRSYKTGSAIVCHTSGNFTYECTYVAPDSGTADYSAFIEVEPLIIG